jgi:formylglycine-generating enzyme required for sulfatase activity
MSEQFIDIGRVARNDVLENFNVICLVDSILEISLERARGSTHLVACVTLLLTFTGLIGCRGTEIKKPGRHPANVFTPPANASAVKQTRINPVDGAVIVWIPEGAFTMGSDEYKNEKPPHPVKLSGYWIYKYPVTVNQFRRFCDATSYTFDWKNLMPAWGWLDDHPMVYVSWNDAQAYCRWTGVGLPSEAQWERAARGPHHFTFPWGNKWDSTKLWFGQSEHAGTAAVHRTNNVFENDYGCVDMAGNVAQWCEDVYNRQYDVDPMKNPLNLKGSSRDAPRVYRGGGYVEIEERFFRCTERSGILSGASSNDWGFRCSSR